jgi:hypothetical protein
LIVTAFANRRHDRGSPLCTASVAARPLQARP